jgi:hypothetical protein
MSVDGNGKLLRNPIYRQVVESVGSIPNIVLGSYWKKGQRVEPKHDYFTREQEIEIVAPAVWVVVKAGEHITTADPARNSATHAWINPSDYPLIFHIDTNERILGLNGRVVSVETTGGQEIIFPCYEIFRAFFGNASDLAHAFLSKTWDRIDTEAIQSGSESDSPDGKHWQIDLSDNGSTSLVNSYAWFHFDANARRAANKIYSSIVQQGSNSRPGWIQAEPPIVGQTLKMKVRVRDLPSRNALLVTQIIDFEFPHKISSFKVTTPIQDVPGDKKETTEHPDPGRYDRSTKTASSVSGPSDSTNTKSYVALRSVTVNMLGMPAPVFEARERKHVPQHGEKKSKGEEDKTEVSVGESNSGKRRPKGKFDPGEEQAVKDRFSALIELLEGLKRSEDIIDARPYPLVRPVPPESPMYCEFPTSGDYGTDYRWANFNVQSTRPRRALVMAIKLEARTIYWIETELMDPNHGKHSLAVEMINGTVLDEGSLDGLLELCARESGVWPAKIQLGAGTYHAVRARHSYLEKKRLSPNMLLRAFEKLWQMGNERRNKVANVDV